MTGTLADKVAVVTGGTSGIGFATARHFAEQGARVFITGRRQDKLDEAVGAIGPAATGVQGDMSATADVERLYSIVREQAGRVDVVVANAGGAKHGHLGELTEESIDYTIAVTLKSTIFTVQGALPLLLEGASVILIGSSTSLRPTPGMAVYGAAKAAVRNLARSWAHYAKDRKFRVNVLSPGPTDTPGLRRALGDDLDAARATVPLGRTGRPEEVASVAAFLATDASSFVNGAELFVDGGQAQI
jgi:NAD(P)-dependent dehydrogenase (short-subunit alcohol dehydrogenase family)